MGYICRFINLLENEGIYQIQSHRAVLSKEEDLVYLAVNSGWFPVTLTLPELPEKYKWHVAVNTGDPKCQFFHKNSMPTVESKIFLGERSVIILIATVI